MIWLTRRASIAQSDVVFTAIERQTQANERLPPVMSNLSFGQSIGIEPLPAQLALRQVSQELCAILWAIIYSDMFATRDDDYYPARIGTVWGRIIAAWSVSREYKALDEVSNRLDANVAGIKHIILSRDYIKVFNFIQFVMQQIDCPEHLINGFDHALVEARAAYRVVDRAVIPIVSEDDAQAITHALKIAACHAAQGPRTHLRSAASNLTNGQWAGAIRESIHAVEAAAKIVEPDANELGPALSRLEKRAAINPAMKRAFGALYGFSSDEKGIRHSLVYGEKANVTEADAMFMFGACAAFVSYLLSQP